MARHRRRVHLACADSCDLHEDGPGLVVFGHRRAGRQQRRRRGRVARRPAAVSFRLLGVVVGRCGHRARARRVPPHRPARARVRSSAATGRARIRARAAVECRARGVAVLSLAGGVAADRRRGARRSHRHEPCAGHRLQWRDAAADRAVRRRLLAVFRRVMVEADGARRRRRRIPARLDAAPLRRARRSRARRAGAGRARGSRRPGQARGARARTDPRRSRAARSPEIGTRDQGATAAAVQGIARFAAAAARPARGCRGGAGHRERRRDRVHVAVDRAQIGRLRRRGEGPRGVSRPRDHALRDRARRRRQRQPDRQPDQGSGPRAVGRQHPRGRDDPRQIVHGPRAAEPEAPDREADRDPVLGHLQRQCEPAHALARQGHRRQDGDRRPRADAASAGRGDHRFGQVGRGQRDDPVAALQVGAAPGTAHPDRSEDARAVGLRRHSASARARSSPT